jgi:DNA-binding MarR family transcriptional regulator
LYFDIFHTKTLNGFINEFGTALFRMKNSFGARMKQFLTGFRRIKPIISYDPLTGAPSLSFSFTTTEDSKITLEDLFSLVAEKSKQQQVVIAIDEFQQIGSYPDINMEALIRGLIQNLHHTGFIFSGSNKSLLSNMFGLADHPLYRSSDMMFLDPLEPDVYSIFIKELFAARKRVIAEETVNEILRWTRMHTYYTQYVCNRLFENELKTIRPDDLSYLKREILEDLDPFYGEYQQLITKQQLQLLKAIACEEGISSITSNYFISKYRLSSSSSVLRGLASLEGKEMIYSRNNKWFVYDPFFSRWLETFQSF